MYNKTKGFCCILLSNGSTLYIHACDSMVLFLFCFKLYCHILDHHLTFRGGGGMTEVYQTELYNMLQNILDILTRNADKIMNQLKRTVLTKSAI